MARDDEAVEQRKRQKMMLGAAIKLGKQNWDAVLLMEASILEHNLKFLSDGQRWIVEELITSKRWTDECSETSDDDAPWVTLLTAEELQLVH